MASRFLTQCHHWLPPRGGSRASGWRSLRNKRLCAYFEIAIFPLSRALPQACKPPALDVLLAKLDRCLQHDSRREPFMCSAQDDLLKCGAIVILRFLGPSRTPVPTGLIVTFIFACRGGYYPPALFNAMSQKAFPCQGRGTACGG